MDTHQTSAANYYYEGTFIIHLRSMRGGEGGRNITIPFGSAIVAMAAAIVTMAIVAAVAAVVGRSGRRRCRRNRRSR